MDMVDRWPNAAPAGEKRTFRKRFTLDKDIERGGAVAVCDNAFTLFIDGKKVSSGDNWQAPVIFAVPALKAGEHES